MQKSLRPVRPPKTGKDPLRQFLDNDGKILRFYCTLDDPRNRREVRKFMLQFFLSDDTLSMVESLPPNSGRDQAPVFAKRQTPPKEFPNLEGKLAGVFQFFVLTKYLKILQLDKPLRYSSTNSLCM